MSATYYWIGWGIITLIYVISCIITSRTYSKRISDLQTIILLKDMQIGVGRSIAENYLKDTEALRTQIEELKKEGVRVINNDRE